MIHGHIHLYDQREERITQVEETTIVNAYAHYVLDYENLSEITKKIKNKDRVNDDKN